MLGRTLLSLCLLCLPFGIVRADSLPVEAVKPAGNDSRAPRADKILREWSAAHQNCVAVQCKFLRIWYDDVFEVQKHAAGEFGYLGPLRGFVKWNAPAQRPKEESLKRGRRGKAYEYQDTEPEAWYWLTDRLLKIDESEKTVDIFTIPQGAIIIAFFDFGDFFKSVDSPLLFVPGMPNKKRLECMIQGSMFQVIRENKSHIWIAGKPKRRKQAAMYQEFKLYLAKAPWRLKAIQLIHPGGNQSSVYIFSEVNFEPGEWDEPDLSGYKILNDLTKEPFEWPVEARYPGPDPETRERGPIEAQRPQQPGPDWIHFLNPMFTFGFALWETVH